MVRIKLMTVILISVSFLLLMGCGSSEKSETGKKKSAIIIGTVAPISGDQGQMGQDLVRGAELAAEEITKNGGLLGREVHALKLDDRADPKEATNAASKLVADMDVVGVVGHLNSGCSIPASVIYHRANLLMVTPASTADELTQQGFPEVFRAVLKNSDQGPAAAVFAKEKLGAKSFAVVDDKTAYGKGLALAFRDKAVQIGLKMVAEEAFNVGEKDFSTLVTKLKAAQPDVVYAGCMFPEGALLMRQGKTRGLEARFISGDGFFAPKLIEIGGSSVEGTIVSFPAPPWEEMEAAQNFLKRYQEKYGEPVKTYAPLAYDAAMIIAEGVRRANSTVRGDIVKALHAKDFKWTGIGGTYIFDDKGDKSNPVPYFYIVQDGKFKLYH
jgi:branched-chain amino acid transport system substrate-binding protein